MSTRPRPLRVLAIGDGRAINLVHEALGDIATIVDYVDLPRLRRDYGNAVAREVLRQIVANDPGPQRPAARKRR